MSRKTFPLLIALIFASSPLSSQALGSFFPEKAGSMAIKLQSSIDEASATIESRRGKAREAQLLAEADAVDAYALIAASGSGQGAWARSDGTAGIANAAASYVSARSRAKAAALVLSSGRDGAPPGAGLTGVSAISASREIAMDTLSGLILASGIGAKAASALEKFLTGKSKNLGRLFPEAAEIAGLLRNAGASGAREAASAAAHRGPEDIARSLVASKARILALAPAAGGAFARLEAVLAAYRAWIAAAPVAAYPGDLASSSPEEFAALAAGASAVSSLSAARASALFAAMAEGDARDAAADDAAGRLAEVWDRSPAPRRRALSALCGLPESTMAVFSAAWAAGGSARRVSPAAAKTSKSLDSLSILAALNGLEAAIAEEESHAGAGWDAVRSSESVLLLLERPELADAAQREPRYASLYAEASRRLAALYAQAAEDASTKLEASTDLVKASTLALGAKPAGIVVRAIDLKLPSPQSGRRLAFFATVTDASGQSVSLPLRADAAGTEYAGAFARAAGFGSAKVDASSFLAKYGQFTVSAYDPEGSNDALVIAVYPGGGGPARLGDCELELALLGGWRP